MAATAALSGHVCEVGFDCAAGLADAGDGFFEAIRLTIDGENLGAFLSEAHGHGAAVAPARADASRRQ